MITCEDLGSFSISESSELIEIRLNQQKFGNSESSEIIEMTETLRMGKFKTNRNPATNEKSSKLSTSMNVWYNVMYR